MPTSQEEVHAAKEAFKDVFYLFSKSIGVIWLAKRMPFLELKDWVKEREQKVSER